MSLNRLSMLIASERVYLLLKVSVVQMALYLNTFPSLHPWTFQLLISLHKTLQVLQVAAIQCNLLPELLLVDLLVEW